MLKRTPLYQNHLVLGAKMAPFAGWEMPVSYPAGIIAEHNAVRNSAGLFDIGHIGLIKVVEGENALSLIQKAATNDASKLEINQCQYSVLCNERGGVIDDILVYRLPLFYLIVANASNADKVLAHLKSINSKAAVSFYDNFCSMTVQGPRAEEITGCVLSASLSGLKHNRALWWRDIIVSRTGYTGEDGFELVVSKREAAALWDGFIRAGVLPCGLGARDTLRLEAGLPLYGHEYDEETTPLEAGYSWAVKFDKGDFAGKSALEKEKKEGLRKRLVGIEVAGRAIPRQGAEIVDSRKLKIGIATSGTFSPTFKKPIALAYLTPHTPSPTPIFVSIRDQLCPAKVVDKVFYKRVK
ncbi:hypothetical protein A2625_04685 [candidate division WOR-1 bacterium RIFCSPHIGHO2_01_FULL_53_15]|uniref:Aminomethyltransferase n=1 Tax=candidate division WOR-1 bacterium RIFCSPHIGHO2_01_FULL_53_15 TaxID=1802564 RepID=A0A1F4PZ97_UNCSA|nr:MAG: hypothetical protein A2625_04685 [candidate division WOR-1 bacterium RIFCSPHIGHO2_01_FULL_53_15]OGC10632.1 MAG: hypothetical protein A3D23_03905 [candidate division WOR-1 bacterium RIFCSPHIGHO2_02_FULL_53_26]